MAETFEFKTIFVIWLNATNASVLRGEAMAGGQAHVALKRCAPELARFFRNSGATIGNNHWEFESEQYGAIPGHSFTIMRNEATHVRRFECRVIGQSPNSLDPYPLWVERVLPVAAGSRARQAVLVIRDSHDRFHVRVVDRTAVQGLPTPIRNRLLALEDEGHLFIGPGVLRITTNGRNLQLTAVPDKTKWERLARYVRDVEGKTRQRKIQVLETLVRDGRVRTMALDCFGRWCQIEPCEFTQASARRTIEKVLEVHHLKGVGQGGSDSLFNLSVLCANHHRLFGRLPEIRQVSIKNSDDLILRHRFGEYRIKRDLSELRRRLEPDQN